MSFLDINPYVRYLRIIKSDIRPKERMGADHRLYYCIEGECSMKVKDELYSLKKGSVLFWKAGIGYCDVEERKKVKIIAANFDLFSSDKYPKIPVAFMHKEKFDESMLVEKSDSEEMRDIPDCVHIPYVNLDDKFEEMLSEYEKREVYYEELCSSLLKNILIHIFRLHYTGRNHISSDKADRIIKYVHAHYNEDITNIKIAEYFSYHPNYISNIIKKRTGMTLHKYLIHYRIHTAIGYIHSGEYSITEVAEMVGYKDMKCFSKSFKHVTGYPPKAYCMK